MKTAQFRTGAIFSPTEPPPTFRLPEIFVMADCAQDAKGRGLAIMVYTKDREISPEPPAPNANNLDNSH